MTDEQYWLDKATMLEGYCRDKGPASPEGYALAFLLGLVSTLIVKGILNPVELEEMRGSTENNIMKLTALEAMKVNAVRILQHLFVFRADPARTQGPFTFG